MSSINTGSMQVFYNYNALGQRVLKRTEIYNSCTVPNRAPAGTTEKRPGATTQTSCNHWPIVSTVRYMYDPAGHLIGEYDSTTGYSQETIWFNGQPVATVQGGQVYYVNADNLGTPRSIVRASDNVELWRWDSDPFGTTFPTAPNPGSGSLTYNLRFPGQFIDESGLHYNGLREYMPQIGRYLEADPIGLSGGLSRYAYVGGNPLNLIDPTGLKVYQIGFTGSFNVPLLGPFGIAAVWSFGVVLDSHGNIGLYGTTTPSAGAGTGAGVSVALSGSLYGGDTIDSFAGPFINSSLGAGLGGYGSVDYYVDPSKSPFDASGVGMGVSLGVGLKGSASVITTNTVVVPIMRCKP